MERSIYYLLFIIVIQSTYTLTCMDNNASTKKTDYPVSPRLSALRGSHENYYRNNTFPAEVINDQVVKMRAFIARRTSSQPSTSITTNANSSNNESGPFEKTNN